MDNIKVRDFISGARSRGRITWRDIEQIEQTIQEESKRKTPTLLTDEYVKEDIENYIQLIEENYEELEKFGIVEKEKLLRGFTYYEILAVVYDLKVNMVFYYEDYQDIVWDYTIDTHEEDWENLSIDGVYRVKTIAEKYTELPLCEQEKDHSRDDVEKLLKKLQTIGNYKITKEELEFIDEIGFFGGRIEKEDQEEYTKLMNFNIELEEYLKAILQPRTIGDLKESIAELFEEK